MEKLPIHPIQGINSDDALEKMQPGEARDVVNCMTKNAPRIGMRIVLLPGTQARFNLGLPSGSNQIVGWCEWMGQNKLVYFVHNGAGNHTIWLYDRDTFVHTLIAQGSYLQIRPRLQELGKLQAQITNDGLLYWNQGYFGSYSQFGGIQDYSPPRKLNINRALSGGYGTIDWQTTMAAKFPYPQSPLVTFLNDPEVTVNRLWRTLVQFRVQYVYDDFERSRWSPISKLAVNKLGEGMKGDNPYTGDVSNCIQVTVNTGHQTVRKIVFAARINNGNWFVFKEYNKDETGIGNFTPLAVRFYNNEEQKFIEIKDQNYDLIPQYCHTQQLLHNNVMAYGGVYENFDPIEINVVAEYRIIDNISNGLGQYVHELEYSISGTPTFREIDFIANYMNGSFFITEQTSFVLSYNLNLPSSDPNQLIQSVYTTSAVYLSPTALPDFLTAWVDFLNTLGHPVTYASTGTTLTVDSSPITFTNFQLRIHQNNRRSKSLKKGVTHVWGIQYYDEVLRDGTVYTSDEMEVYIKHPSQEDLSGLSENNDEYVVLPRFVISHRPPIWAKYWQIVYFGNKEIQSFQQRTVARAELDTGSVGRVKLSLEVNYQNTYPGTNYWHAIEVGDQVRLYRRRLLTKGTADYVKEDVVLDVMAYDPTGGLTGGEAIWVENFDYVSFCGGDRAFLIEIYRPRKTGDELAWREIGDVNAIIEPHTGQRRHSVSQPAGGGAFDHDIDFGDVYMRNRRMGTGSSNLVPGEVMLSWIVEDFNYSDYWESNHHDYGRLAIKDIDVRKRFVNKIVASEKLIQDGQVNGLSRFNFGSNIVLSADYGQIRRMEEVGFTLKVLSDRMNTSVYVERQETYGADGNTSVMFVQQTLGDQRPHQETWGVQVGRMAVRVERQLYYWDFVNDDVIEDSANGQRSIGRGTKAIQFLRLAKATLQGQSLEDSFASYDPEHDLVIFGMKSRDFGFTVAYNRRYQKWDYRTDFYYRDILSIGDTVYAWDVNNQLQQYSQGYTGEYTSNAGSPTISFPVALQPLAVIVARSVELWADTRVPGKMIFTAFRSGSYQEMEAIVNELWWQEYESRWASYISGDKNDPAVLDYETDEAKYLDGRELRGEVVLVTHSDWSKGDIRGYIFHVKKSEY